MVKLEVGGNMNCIKNNQAMTYMCRQQIQTFGQVYNFRNVRWHLNYSQKQDGWMAGRPTNRRTNRQTDGQIDRWPADRQADR